ncbi:MAG: c-type cytochrome [Candidatus Xenobia bacterium]
MPKLCAEFPDQDTALAAHRAVVDEGVPGQDIEIRSSYPMAEGAIPPHRQVNFHLRRNVKMLWFIGGICGFLLVTTTQWFPPMPFFVGPIYTGGHQLVPLPIDLIITYECAMITGLISTCLLFFWETKPFRKISPPIEEDLPVARGNIALIVEGEESINKAQKALEGKNAMSIVTYAVMFIVAAHLLTGCEVRMRNQPSIKGTQAAAPPQPPGTVAMPTELQTRSPRMPVFGYWDFDDVMTMKNELGKDPIPKELVATRNPMASDPKSVERGQTVFQNNCFFCHGQDGKGDGPVGEVFKPKPSDLTSPEAKALSDGGMYWMITTGPDTMPPFDNRLTSQQRWDVISYIRSLQK